METLEEYKKKEEFLASLSVKRRKNKKILDLFFDKEEHDATEKIMEVYRERQRCVDAIEKVSLLAPHIIFTVTGPEHQVVVNHTCIDISDDTFLEKRGVDTFFFIQEAGNDHQPDMVMVTESTRDLLPVSYKSVNYTETDGIFFGKRLTVNPDLRYVETDNLISIPECVEILDLHRNNRGEVVCDSTRLSENEMNNIVHFGDVPHLIVQRICHLYFSMTITNIRTGQVHKFLNKKKENDYFWIDIVKIGDTFCYLDLFTDEMDNDPRTSIVQCGNGKEVIKLHGFCENVVTCRDFVVLRMNHAEINVLSV